MLPLPLDIVVGEREVWNSCRSSRDEGSQAEDKADTGRRAELGEHKEADTGWPPDQITTEHNTESAHFLFFPLSSVWLNHLSQICYF